MNRIIAVVLVIAYVSHKPSLYARAFRYPCRSNRSNRFEGWIDMRGHTREKNQAGWCNPPGLPHEDDWMLHTLPSISAQAGRAANANAFACFFLTSYTNTNNKYYPISSMQLSPFSVLNWLYVFEIIPYMYYWWRACIRVHFSPELTWQGM